jgi:hypothetical protein
MSHLSSFPTRHLPWPRILRTLSAQPDGRVHDLVRSPYERLVTTTLESSSAGG